MKTFIIDDVSPEDIAMLQALYSRSAESAETQLQKLQKTGSGRFLDNYVVGYGHKSIADCGSTTVFFEGVSLLAAKAIQDWPLYAGQETSTRYIDFTKQPIIDPLGTPESKSILDQWMGFYVNSQDAVAEGVKSKYPKKPDEDPVVYQRAVKARVFDILRGFLPAGITTQLSWHSNLRQMGDHLTPLTQHPLQEVRQLAQEAETALAARYPHSGFLTQRAGLSGIGKGDQADARSEWEKKVAQSFSYFGQDFKSDRASVTPEDLEPYQDLLSERPRGSVLPHFLSDLGQMRFANLLDFGSFRDLQRHRNGVCRMPLLSTSEGFERWYLEQLPPDVLATATALVQAQQEAIKNLPCEATVKQYYVALGFRVPCVVTYPLPSAVYVLELRSGKMVHPTLRNLIQEKMVPFFQSVLPNVKLHIDNSPNDWDVRRGTQTITEKNMSDLVEPNGHPSKPYSMGATSPASTETAPEEHLALTKKQAKLERRHLKKMKKRLKKCIKGYDGSGIELLKGVLSQVKEIRRRLSIFC